MKTKCVINENSLFDPKYSRLKNPNELKVKNKTNISTNVTNVSDDLSQNIKEKLSLTNVQLNHVENMSTEQHKLQMKFNKTINNLFKKQINLPPKEKDNQQLFKVSNIKLGNGRLSDSPINVNNEKAINGENNINETKQLKKKKKFNLFSCFGCK